jgi:hypothetical protein
LDFGVVSGCILPGEAPDPPPGGDPLDAYVETLKDHPTDMDAHASLLREQIKRGDVEGARGTVTHALFHCGKDFHAHFLAAQFHRWQYDFLSAEKSLIEARELAPANVEPRVALAALYRDTMLEREELEQRKLAVELIEKKFKPELDLDYAYSLAQAGEAQAAGDAARRVIIAEGAGQSRFRAWILLGQLALDAGKESEAVAAALEARKEAPTERGPIRFAARLAGALQNPQPLLALFDDVLAKQEDPDSRFFALFGAWTASTKLAIILSKDADGPDAHGYWTRLRDLDPGQLDAISRRYQVISLLPAHKEETAALRKMLEEMQAGIPPVPNTLAELVRLWRAQDCLMLNAARPCLQEIETLQARWPSRDLFMLKANALFGARDDDACLVQLAQLKDETKGEMPELRFMRWVVQLRKQQAREVMREIEAAAQGDKADNSTLLMEAITRFRTYRKAANAGGK